LKNEEQWKFKVHAYRAMLEKLISEKYNVKRIQIGSVKCTENMLFKK